MSFALFLLDFNNAILHFNTYGVFHSDFSTFNVASRRIIIIMFGSGQSFGTLWTLLLFIWLWLLKTVLTLLFRIGTWSYFLLLNLWDCCRSSMLIYLNLILLRLVLVWVRLLLDRLLNTKVIDINSKVLAIIGIDHQLNRWQVIIIVLYCTHICHLYRVTLLCLYRLLRLNHYIMNLVRTSSICHRFLLPVDIWFLRVISLGSLGNYNAIVGVLLMFWWRWLLVLFLRVGRVTVYGVSCCWW